MLQQQQQQQQQWQNFVSRSAFFDKNQQVADHLEASSKLSFIFEKKDVNDNSVCDHPELLVKITPNITVGGSCLDDIICGDYRDYEHVKTDQSDIVLEFEYGRKDASTTFDTHTSHSSQALLTTPLRWRCQQLDFAIRTLQSISIPIAHHKHWPLQTLWLLLERGKQQRQAKLLTEM